MGVLPAMLLQGKNLLLGKAVLLVFSDLQDNQRTVSQDKIFRGPYSDCLTETTLFDLCYPGVASTTACCTYCFWVWPSLETETCHLPWCHWHTLHGVYWERGLYSLGFYGWRVLLGGRRMKWWRIVYIYTTDVSLVTSELISSIDYVWHSVTVY